MTRMRCLWGLAPTLLSLAVSPPEGQDREWSLSKAVEILNSSPWARQETFTRVVAGVGSGVSGEKELFNAFNHANFKNTRKDVGNVSLREGLRC